VKSFKMKFILKNWFYNDTAAGKLVGVRGLGEGWTNVAAGGVWGTTGQMTAMISSRTLVSAWVQQAAKYDDGAADCKTFDSLVKMPGSKQRSLIPSALTKLEVNSGVQRPTAREDNWLSYGVSPGAGVNNTRYFNPTFQVAMGNCDADAALTAETLTWSVDMDYVVEFRGRKI